MPAPRLTKASLSNAVAALKEQGFTPSRVNLNPDGSFSIDIDAPHMEQHVEKKKGPKRWSERSIQ